MVIEYDFKKKRKITKCKICDEPSEKEICEKCEVEIMIESGYKELMR